MDAIELLTQDHREVERLFTEYESGSDGQKENALTEIIRELSIHSAIEEAYVYPLIRKSVPRGDELAGESEHEHQQVKEQLARLDGKVDKAHTQEVARQVETLKKNVMHHVEEEESEVFPSLAQSVSKTELEQVGRELKKAKDGAPTRPHPNQPAANALTTWANGILDRARDRVSGRA